MPCLFAQYGLVTSDLCNYSHQQTMNHIVGMCLSMKFDGRLARLHKADVDEASWLNNMVTTAFTK